MKSIFRQLVLFSLALITLVSLVACGGGSGGVTGVPSHASVIPSAPSNISSTADNEQVTVTWTAVSGALSYNVYWSTTPGVMKTTGMKISNITNTTLLHTGLVNDTIYYYVVTAVNTNGESTESAQTAAQPVNTPPPPPPAPSI